MRVAMMQPTFLPWLGYFELIMQADKFIFLDDFQFVYRSFHRRNKILQDGKELPLTVPVDRKSNDKKPLNKVVINEALPWREKNWRIIEVSYSRSKFFSQYAEIVYPLFSQQAISLGEQNIRFISKICEILGIDDKFMFSSHMRAEGSRSIKNKRLLEEADADLYLCANGSFEYMLEDGVFPLANIDVEFQNAVPKPYLQHGNKGDFVPYLSVLDALFNIGAEATREKINSMTNHWLSWDEMLNLHGTRHIF